MPSARTVLQAYDADEGRMLRLYASNLRAGAAYKRNVDAYITRQLSEVSLRGALRNDMVTQVRLETMARELPELMRTRFAEEYNDVIMANVRTRVRSIDATMSRVGLRGAMLGDRAFLLPSYLNRTSIIADAITRGSVRASQRVADALLSFKIGAPTGATLNELKDLLVQRAGVATQYAGTVANTELAALDRDLRVEQTRAAGLQLMRYTGPVDKTTREFCLTWVGQVHPVEFWDELTNPTGPNPASQYGGGFNCRHRLLPWSEEWED